MLDYEASIDDGPYVLQRSSGAIVSTQLGSTAWVRSAWMVHEQQVAAVLRAAAPPGSVAAAPARDGGAAASTDARKAEVHVLGGA